MELTNRLPRDFFKINHVLINIPTGTIDDAIVFYTDILGCEQITGEHPNEAVWFTFGNIELHVREEEDINVAKSSRHIAMEVKDLLLFTIYLESKDMEIQYSSEIEGRKRLFIRDPFGNRFEFIEFKKPNYTLK
ncbi:VOC family protein [Sphingobacterium hungaricum]|uniref:Phage portal protein n=1 Tax=Sphingobacterium hungaricum TaxID=2082723 RepID=A0A928UVP3_9SPHI|nr:VOC family protein [Sphingobacterium hungaricum]MBE8712160.1 phage portal protein [Sphingobacterium hungaricum]